MAPLSSVRDRGQRYVAWLLRNARLVLALAVVTFLAAVYLIAFHLPLKADFAYLLPADSPAVRDQHRLEQMVAVQDTALVLVLAPTPEVRAHVVGEMIARLRALPASQIAHLETDDADTRAFLKANRHLFISVEDLQRAYQALTERVAAAKLAANPLYVAVDDDEDAKDAAKARADLDDLDRRRKEAEARLDRSSNISADGKAGLVVVRTAFAQTDVTTGKVLIAELERARDEVMAANPGVNIGIAGGVLNVVAEHEALENGMLLSSLVTAFLVGLVLILYFRSVMLLAILTVSLVSATAMAFGAAALTVGHLNAATAFLGAIIAGNGVNYGILLIARYLEERRALDPEPAMAAAIAGTMRPTLVASLGASIAYGSLAATSFRGFADFAIIGAIGMVLCWISAITVLPVLVLRLAPSPRMPRGEPLIGRVLARLLGFRRPAVVAAVTAALAIGAGVITYQYVAADPFEYDIKKLRSEGADAVSSRDWMAVSDKLFGSGISGQTYIAADRPAQVPLIIAALRKVDEHAAPGQETFGTIHSILELVPEHQPEKLALLAKIRALLDDPALEELEPDERARLADLRPPDDLKVITTASLPAEIADKLRERGGTIGYIIGVRPGPHLDDWNGHDLIRFATAIRKIELPDGETVTTSGPSVIFADVVGAIQADGPGVTLVAAIGLVLMVLIVVGRNRQALAVLIATALGALGLTAACALLGVRVNFLDFVALPITLGLGVDYAINVAHRHHQEGAQSARATLMTSGSAVFLCSLTTIIGYGSLLVSDNLAIRGFGFASLIGEVACLTTALVVVPAVLSLGRSRA
ncbi:MAG: MMPL family transporter [Deltaproteobacteria bacterium]|nr:MMPL family transporter [Deltaproteobacteria bacterium]